MNRNIFRVVAVILMITAFVGFIASGTGTSLLPFPKFLEQSGGTMAVSSFIGSLLFYILSKSGQSAATYQGKGTHVADAFLKWVFIIVPLFFIVGFFFLLWFFNENGGFNIN